MSISSSAQLYHRIRSNDPSLVCLRFTPSLSLAHLSDALLSNSTITQVVAASGGTTTPAPRIDGGSVIPIDAFAQFFASLHHLPLKVLNVSELRLTDVHIRHIVEFLVASKTIHRVDISRNLLSVDSAKRLATAVACHPSLKVLELASCGLGDAGVAQLIGTLSPEACALETLNLSNNFITAVSWKPLTEFVLENTTLLHLPTRGNFIQATERAALVEPALARNLETKTKRTKAARPSSALGFLSTLDQQTEATTAAVSSKDKMSSSRQSSADAVRMPSLEILSKQLEEENRQQQ